MQPSGNPPPIYPSSSSQLSVKRKLSFTRRFEEINSSETTESTLHVPVDVITGSTNQPKRQKTVWSPPSSDTYNNETDSMAQVASYDVVDLTKDTGRTPKFQPQTGVRKLVIKNLRRESRANLIDHYNDVWDEISNALTAIFSGKQPCQPLERLYRDVEDICRNGQSEKLFQHVNENCITYLQNSLLPQILANDQVVPCVVETLRNVYKAWEIWSSRTVQIRSIFSFLDRSFLLQSKYYPQLNDMAVKQFRRVICESEHFGTQIYLGICELIKADRMTIQNSFDSILLKNSIIMLHIMDLYQVGFEPVFLQTSNRFFEENNSQRWAMASLEDYISNCTSLLEREGLRCDMYNFDGSSKRALLTQAHSILIRKSAKRILDKNAISELLENHRVNSLRELYGLLKTSGMQEQLKEPWEYYIKKAGSTIVGDGEKSDNMVIRLLELKRSLEALIRDSFGKDDFFKFAMREAYSGFINDRKNTTTWGTGNSKVGEVIAKYIDMLLRGGLKAIPRSLTLGETEKLGQTSMDDEDAELDRQLEQGVELFRFIEGKDVFEAFYKKDLARRLLMSRSASQDAERNMLTKLKSECGSNFTHNLEQMFKDQELSRDEMSSYNQTLSDMSHFQMDLQVSVLSAAAWPTYPDIEVNLPTEVASHIERFDKYYKQKNTGRHLSWKHALAHSIVRANFPKGTKELSLSAFQAIVLVLFNNISANENLSYKDLQSATGLTDAELKRTLQSLACAKFRILNKHPRGRDIIKTDTFTVNLNFSAPKYRLKVNQIQLKETKEENEETHEQVSLDRQYETQAAVVRIMKSRKVMTHGNLVAEVINQTKARGAMEPVEIKKNIEKLIEKDYLERDGNSYTYLA